MYPFHPQYDLDNNKNGKQTVECFNLKLCLTPLHTQVFCVIGNLTNDPINGRNHVCYYYCGVTGVLNEIRGIISIFSKKKLSSLTLSLGLMECSKLTFIIITMYHSVST